MRVRTLAKNEPFGDDPETGHRTPRPERGSWWELSLLSPGFGSGGFWLGPSIEWERHDSEIDVEVHWLLWGLALWWHR